jgi:hypothetical protein
MGGYSVDGSLSTRIREERRPTSHRRPPLSQHLTTQHKHTINIPASVHHIQLFVHLIFYTYPPNTLFRSPSRVSLVLFVHSRWQDTYYFSSYLVLFRRWRRRMEYYLFYRTSGREAVILSLDCVDVSLSLGRVSYQLNAIPRSSLVPRAMDETRQGIVELAQIGSEGSPTFFSNCSPPPPHHSSSSLQPWRPSPSSSVQPPLTWRSKKCPRQVLGPRQRSVRCQSLRAAKTTTRRGIRMRRWTGIVMMIVMKMGTTRMRSGRWEAMGRERLRVRSEFLPLSRWWDADWA